MAQLNIQVPDSWHQLIEDKRIKLGIGSKSAFIRMLIEEAIKPVQVPNTYPDRVDQEGQK